MAFIDLIENPDAVPQEGDTVKRQIGNAIVTTIYHEPILPSEEEEYSKNKQTFDQERVLKFKETEWVRQRHSDNVDLGIDDSTNWDAWLNYWQSLRDLPEQPDFDPINPSWPTKPE